MRVIKVSIFNFMSFEEAHIQYDEQGLILVEGKNLDADSFDSNGAGKSSLICEPLVWCLFDTTVRGSKKDQVVNAQAGKDCFVKMTFEQGGETYTVTRFRKHTDHGNKLILWRNQDDLTRSTVRDTQAELDRILGVNQNVFMYTAILGQGMPNRFSELTDAGRKTLIESIIGTDVYEKARVKARDIVKAKDLELAGIRGRVEQQEAAIEAHKARIASREAEAEGLRAESAETLLRLNDEVGYLESEMTQIEEQIVEFEKMKPVLEEKINVAQITVNEWSVAMTEFNRERDARKFKFDELNRKKTRLAGLGSQCPTCDQAVTAEYVGKLSAPMDDELGRLDNEIVEIEGHRQLLHEKQEAINKAMRETQSLLTTHVNEAFARQKRLSEVKAKREQISSQVEIIKTQLGMLDEEIKKLHWQTDEMQNELVIIRHAQTLAEEDKAYDEFWMKAFPEIRAAALANSIVFINERLNHYLSELSDLELSMGLVLKNDKIDIITSTRGGTYSSASGGERRRMDMAMALALNDLAAASSGFSINFLVCDEPADFIDNAGMDRLVILLTEKARKLGSVFIISHNPVLKSSIANRITVTKQDGVSAVATAA